MSSRFAMILARLGKIRPRYRISRKLYCQLLLYRSQRLCHVGGRVSLPLMIPDQDSALFPPGFWLEVFSSLDDESDADQRTGDAIEASSDEIVGIQPLERISTIQYLPLGVARGLRGGYMLSSPGPRDRLVQQPQ